MIRKLLFQTSSIQALFTSLLLGLMAALLAGAIGSLALAESALQRSLVVSVFLSPTFSDQEALRLADTLKANDPELISAKYISKLEALQEAQKDPTLAKTLLLLKENPLPSTLLITYSDRAWLERGAPAETLPSTPPIQEIRWDPSARTVFRSVDQWRQWLLRLAVFSGCLLTLCTFFGIYRFVARRCSLAQLGFPVIFGVLGGAFAFLAWTVALNRLGADAAVYRPSVHALWPLWAGAAAGLAWVGLGAKHED